MAGLHEEHLQKLQANFRGNIPVSTESVRLQETPNTMEPVKYP
jgi:hypothetical protein